MGLVTWGFWNLSSSVQFSHSVMSNSPWPHEPQNARPPRPSPTPGVYPKPCPLSWWCHPAISFSVVPFSSSPQSFPASESFPKSQLFISGGQSIGVSASTSVLPMNTQDWSPYYLFLFFKLKHTWFTVFYEFQVIQYFYRLYSTKSYCKIMALIPCAIK